MSRSNFTWSVWYHLKLIYLSAYLNFYYRERDFVKKIFFLPGQNDSLFSIFRWILWIPQAFTTALWGTISQFPDNTVTHTRPKGWLGYGKTLYLLIECLPCDVSRAVITLSKTSHIYNEYIYTFKIYSFT